MTPQDYDAFSLEFRRISSALGGYKIAPSELEAKIDAYFTVLKGFSLDDVKAKADVWLQTQTKMPKPAEWAAVVVRHAVDLDVMPEREARDWRAAEQSRWEGPPCGCQSCVEAGVNEKPLRFVPDDGKAVEPLSKRLVNRGHWAHGFELFRYYKAKADFYNRCVELGLKGDVLAPKPKRKPFEERLKEIFPEREIA